MDPTVTPRRLFHARSTPQICPKAGRNLQYAGQILTLLFMRPFEPDPDLVRQVSASTGLPDPVAGRLVTDVLAFYAEPVEDFVRRRHAELKTYGARNPQIFARIAEELSQRPFAAPRFSERQLRRLIYG
jgi:hypothetical protein